jgi:hypothetical protein
MALSSEVLSLYRQLLRYGQSLQFTDKDYFQRRIRYEFERYRNTQNVNTINKQLERGRALLKNDRLL